MIKEYKKTAATSGVLLIVFFSWFFGTRIEENKQATHFDKLNSVKLNIVPQPKISKFEHDTLYNIQIEPGYGNKLHQDHESFFSWLQKSFKRYDGLPTNIIVHFADSVNLPDSIATRLRQNESYFISFKKGSISIIGHDTLGILDGLVTLRNYLIKTNGKVRKGFILDWPDFKIRAFHFVARFISQKTAIHILQEARAHQFNTLVVQLSDGVKVDTSLIPTRKNAWSKSFLQNLSQITKEFGMKFIPEIKLLSHQNKFYKKSYPSLMYNSETYNPTKPKSRHVVEAYLNKLIKLIHPTIIHIGHDEIWGIARNSKLPASYRSLPAKLFKKSILFLYNFLHEKGIKVWMWGDMFLDQKDFPEMNQGPLNANTKYAKVLKKIPKDIVICDWHYSDKGPNFPSSKYFASNGFDVIGTTWKKEITIKNFSQYVYKMDDHGLGMMATTWWPLQAGSWRVINKILNISGEHFWNAEQYLKFYSYTSNTQKYNGT